MVTARQTKSAPVQTVLLIGVLLYVVSWLVPVFQGQELFGAMGGFAQSLGASPEAGVSALSGPDWLPGWSACHLAWNLLTEQQQAPDGDDWKRIVLGSTCLTNVAMLAGLLVLALGARPRALGVLLLACAVLNTSWVFLGGEELTEALRAGYYLWAGSFLVTGIGLLNASGPSPRA